MKHTRKILALVLIVMTVLMSLSVISVSAEDAETGTKTVVKTFESKDLEPKAKGEYTDGQPVEAGTDNFFTLHMSANTKVDSSTKTWDDGYSSSQRLNLGGKSTTSKQVISITTQHPATVKIWWVCGGDGGRYIAIWDADKNEVAYTNKEVAKDSINIDTLEIPTAGSYFIACPINNNYIFKIEVSWTEALADSTTCEHEYADATCTAPKTCPKCNATEGEALGHAWETVEEVPATCMTNGAEAGQTCSRCGEKEGQVTISATGHKYTFTVTQPTAAAPGSITGTCSVEGCGATFESGEINVMTPGNSYDLQASELGVITSYTLSDGYVKVVDGVFACHLSYKLKVEDGRESKDSFSGLKGWASTHRINLQGASEILEDGTIKNFIQIVTTGKTTITVAWSPSNPGRELAIYDMNGNPIEGMITSVNATSETKNQCVVSTFELPAGAYLIGNYIPEGVGAGGSYIHRVMVDVECPGHTWVDATCTAPKTCSTCGATEGELAEHNYANGECSDCKAADPNYNPEQPADPEQPAEQPELNFFQKILAWFMELINKILGIFKK